MNSLSKCPQCEAPYESDENICSNCGETLSNVVALVPEPRTETTDPPSEPTPAPEEEAASAVEEIPIVEFEMADEGESEVSDRGPIPDPDPVDETSSGGESARIFHMPPSIAPQERAEQPEKPPPLKEATPTDTRYQTVRLEEHNVKGILDTCRNLIRKRYRLYGLFGRAQTGKSCLVYALKRHFEKGAKGFGGFTPEGSAWGELAKDLEGQWRSGKFRGHARGLYPYPAVNPNKRSHIALLDIAGEHFQDVSSWSEEIFDFFGAFFAHCKGLFVLVELDENTLVHLDERDPRSRKGKQIQHIVNFLTVAATLKKMKKELEVDAKRKIMDKALGKVGKARIKMPVCLGLSKADRVKDMYFGPEIQTISPGTETRLGDPWEAARNLWPAHYDSLLKRVPRLKIEWLSCLGTGFEDTHGFSGSLGLRAAFDHVVLNPPPWWSLSTKTYLKLQKLDLWLQRWLPFLREKDTEKESLIHYPYDE